MEPPGPSKVKMQLPGIFNNEMEPSGSLEIKMEPPSACQMENSKKIHKNLLKRSKFKGFLKKIQQIEGI